MGKKLLFATIVIPAFFVLAELVLSTIGVATLIEKDDPFRGFSGLVKVFERDGEVYRTRRGSLPTFNDQSFLVNKPANGLRLFCLGGSSSYGFPWGAEAAFTGIVGDALAASHPELRVEAVNASGVSYAMHRLNIVADELLEYSPDLFIVYSGHNEFIEPAFFDALEHRSRARTRLEYWLAHSRLYSGMASLRDQAAAAGRQFETRVRRDPTGVFSREKKEAIVREYRWRLERLVSRAQSSGVRVVLVTVPCNLRDWPPEASTAGDGLTDETFRRWTEALRTGKLQLEANEFETAIASLEIAARLAPEDADTQFLLARAYEGLSRWGDAGSAYRRACDADASPTRRVSGINQAVRAVARQSGALLVEIDRVFEQHSEHGLVGLNLIEDYVHPTREGHELIAWHVWDAIERAGWLGETSVADKALFERLVAERRRRPMTRNSAWFFNQGVVLDHQGQTEAAIEKYRQALEASPDYRGALQNLASLLNETGKQVEAIDLCKRLIAVDPANAEAHNLYGRALHGLGRTEEAVAHFAEALRIKPDHAEVHNNWGVALALSGRRQEALQHYREALRINPDQIEAHANLGSALMELGRAGEAVPHFRKVLRTRPEDADALHNLANALHLSGDLTEATRYYRQALRIQPEFAEAHHNLGLALAGQDMLEQAAEQFEQALRIDPQYEQARSNLAQARARLGGDR